MMDKYHERLLEVIKKYDHEEYKDLMDCPYGGIVEDHLDALAEQFPNIKDFEEVMKKKNDESLST